MSASSKPPRGWSTRPPSTERVARVLLDAETFGDRRAAEKAGIARRTLYNWRREWGASPAVLAEMARLRQALDDGWVAEGRRARRKLMARIDEVASSTDDLAALSTALRRVHEVILSHEIVHDPDSDAEPHLADQREDPEEAPGPRGEDEDEDDG